MKQGKLEVGELDEFKGNEEKESGKSEVKLGRGSRGSKRK